MPKADRCTYCERPAVSACLRRQGPLRANPYDPRNPDKSTVIVVRFCEVDHFHAVESANSGE